MASSWQTLANVLTVVRTLSGKDSTTLTDATLLPIANKYYFLMVRELIGLNEDLYAEISSTDLVLNQREYSLPTDDTASTYGAGLIKLQRVEVSYDNSTWQVADSIPFSDIKTTTILDSDISNHYNISNPKYYFKDRSVWLVPTPGSGDYTTAGNANLRIFWVKRPNEMTATSAVPDLPKDWLSILQDGILYDTYRIYGRLDDARDSKENWQIGLNRMKELEQNINREESLSLKTIYKNYN